jgi:hypothetical protein
MLTAIGRTYGSKPKKSKPYLGKHVFRIRLASTLALHGKLLCGVIIGGRGYDEPFARD